MTEGWINYSTAVVEYACLMVPGWKEILGIDTDIETLPADEKDNLALFMLPLIFGNKAKMRSGGRCSLTDSMSSFIDAKLEKCHLPSFLDKINPSQRPQPFILCLYAAYKLNPTQIFVILEREAISIDTLLKAVDMCNKLHLVFDLQYQNLCKGVWEFLQSCVYEQGGATLSSNVRAFRAYLKNGRMSIA